MMTSLPRESTLFINEEVVFSQFAAFARTSRSGKRVCSRVLFSTLLVCSAISITLGPVGVCVVTKTFFPSEASPLCRVDGVTACGKRFAEGIGASVCLLDNLFL